MKRAIILCVLMLVSAIAFAQSTEPGFTDAQAHTSARSFGSRSSAFKSMVAYGSYRLGEDTRYGPAIFLQYSPNYFSTPSLDIFVGTMLHFSGSNTINQQEYIPVAHMFAARYPLNYSSYYAENYGRPSFSIGLAFIGTNLTFYLTEGNVRPYAGIGGMLLFYPYAEKIGGTLAPDAKAGLDIKISTAFAGFAEVRRTFGVPSLIGPNSPKFGGLTAAAIGVSFAPQLR
ncbi:MAG: hypothetical protein HY089_01905 [Ignavibacteriales bacterium]|nr:hypothetical protein [Ignavibacteriales bacterium]